MSPGPLPQFDRQEVLLRAMELFWAKGFQGTGMAELVAHVGIGRQSLYNAFGNKRSLFLEALHAYKSVMVDELLVKLDAPGSPLTKVREVLRERVAMITDEESFHGCMMGNTSAELGDSDPEIAAIFQRAMTRVVDAFERTLERAKEAGELDPASDSRALACTLVATAQGLEVIAQSNPDPDFAQQILAGLDALLSPVATP